jgi:hypothetical protein
MTPHPMDAIPAAIAEEDLALPGTVWMAHGGNFERRWVDFATLTWS